MGLAEDELHASRRDGEWISGACPRCNGQGGCGSRFECFQGEVFEWVPRPPKALKRYAAPPGSDHPESVRAAFKRIEDGPNRLVP